PERDASGRAVLVIVRPERVRRHSDGRPVSERCDSSRPADARRIWVRRDSDTEASAAAIADTDYRADELSRANGSRRATAAAFATRPRSIRENESRQRPAGVDRP